MSEYQIGNDDELLYSLTNAANRLQLMANNARGTVWDDNKVYGLEKEANAILEALRQIQSYNNIAALENQLEQHRNSDVKTLPTGDLKDILADLEFFKSKMEKALAYPKPAPEPTLNDFIVKATKRRMSPDSVASSVEEILKEEVFDSISDELSGDLAAMRDPPKVVYREYHVGPYILTDDEHGMIFRNPAISASPVRAPSGKYREYTATSLCGIVSDDMLTTNPAPHAAANPTGFCKEYTVGPYGFHIRTK